MPRSRDIPPLPRVSCPRSTDEARRSRRKRSSFSVAGDIHEAGSNRRETGEPGSQTWDVAKHASLRGLSRRHAMYVNKCTSKTGPAPDPSEKPRGLTTDRCYVNSCVPLQFSLEIERFFVKTPSNLSKELYTSTHTELRARAATFRTLCEQSLTVIWNTPFDYLNPRDYASRSLKIYE